MATKKTTTKTNKQRAKSKQSARNAVRANSVNQRGKSTHSANNSPMERKASGLDLAADVVAKANEPLTCKSIAEKTIAAGWQTKGQTPHATLYSAMIREIEKKGRDARFKKVGRGQFAANSKAK